MDGGVALLPGDAPVGVFDSGVGGLSVLRHIRAQLPHEHLLYVADTGFAPYGDKPEHVVAARSLLIAEFFIERGAKALVVACNTATAAAIKMIRSRYPLMPVVGVEPGLKPATLLTHTGKIGVLATDMTLAGEKFRLLQAQIAEASKAEFLPQACIGLVQLIEAGELDTPATLALLERYVKPLLERGADTLVLGCTHYPFVMPAIAQVVAQAGYAPVALVDTGEAVARQLVRLLDGAGLLRVPTSSAPNLSAANLSAPGVFAAPARLEGFTSAGQAGLKLAFSSLLGLTPPVTEIRLAAPLPA